MNKDRLREVRESAGKSQRMVALALGIDRTTYVKYEQGISNPNAKRLAELADYFGVSIDYLMGEDNQGNSEPDKIFPNGKFDLQLFKENSPGEYETSVDDLIKRAMELLSQMDEEHKKAALLQLEALAALNRK